MRVKRNRPFYGIWYDEKFLRSPSSASFLITSFARYIGGLFLKIIQKLQIPLSLYFLISERLPHHH